MKDVKMCKKKKSTKGVSVIRSVLFLQWPAGGARDGRPAAAARGPDAVVQGRAAAHGQRPRPPAAAGL